MNFTICKFATNLTANSNVAVREKRRNDHIRTRKFNLGREIDARMIAKIAKFVCEPESRKKIGRKSLITRRQSLASCLKRYRRLMLDRSAPVYFLSYRTIMYGANRNRVQPTTADERNFRAISCDEIQMSRGISLGEISSLFSTFAFHAKHSRNQWEQMKSN